MELTLLFLSFVLIILSAIMIMYSHLVHKTIHKTLLYFGSVIPISVSGVILGVKGVGFVIVGLCVFAILLTLSFMKIK